MVRGNHRQSTTSHCRFRWVADVDFKCICYRTIRTPWSGIPSKTKLKEKSLKDSDNYLEIRSVCERVFHEKYDRKMCKANHKTRNLSVPLCLLAWSFIMVWGKPGICAPEISAASGSLPWSNFHCNGMTS